MTGEPSRLLESEGLGESLQTDLARAAAHDVGYDVEAGAARFEAMLASGGAPPEGAGEVAAGGSLAKGLSLVVGLAVVVGGGAIAWSLAGSDDGSPKTVAAAPSAVEVIDEAPSEPMVPERGAVAEGVEPLVPSEPAAPAEVEVPDVVPPSEPEARPRGETPPIRRPKTAAPNDDDRLRREMQATDRARQALAGEPKRALALVGKANREFKGGLFAEDREGIAILALFGLDRDDEARRRAQAFLRAHPKSSYADKIRAAMDDAG